MVRPSCPVFVVHENDEFRKSLIAALDQQHFTVTFSSDGPEAVEILRDRSFSVVLLGVNLATGAGTRAVEFLQASGKRTSCGVLIVGDPHPEIRTLAPWADETLLKPVDPTYVATRARTYCDC